MNELTRFFDKNQIRIIEQDGEVLFVGKDVCEALGYKDVINAIKLHCRGVAKYHPITDSLGRHQEVRVIGEPDLFRLVIGSNLPKAEDFERWVFEEVLPSIRRTGAYVSPAIGLEDCVSMVNKLSGQLHEIMEQNAILREKNAYLEQFEPKDEYGTVNANGKPKYQQRRGCYVSAKGTEPARMDPDKNGYLQLDFFYDLVPTMLVDKIKGIVLNLRSNKSNELPGGES